MLSDCQYKSSASFSFCRKNVANFRTKKKTCCANCPDRQVFSKFLVGGHLSRFFFFSSEKFWIQKKKKIVSNLLQLFRHQRHRVEIFVGEEQESERLERIGPELSVIRGRHLAVQRPLHQVLRHHQADRRHRVRVLIRRRQRISFLRKKKL